MSKAVVHTRASRHAEIPAKLLIMAALQGALYWEYESCPSR